MGLRAAGRIVMIGGAIVVMVTTGLATASPAGRDGRSNASGTAVSALAHTGKHKRCGARCNQVKGCAASAPASTCRNPDLFRGVPQTDRYLGSPNAPAYLIWVGELQCPFCAMFANSILPAVVRSYVRTGRLQMFWDGVAFIGPESKRAARVALAAGLQNRLWNFVSTFYAHQHAENSGYVTWPFLNAIAHKAPGLNVRRALRAASSSIVSRQLAEAQELANRLGAESTPTFFLEPRDLSKVTRLQFSELTVAAFTQALEGALATIAQPPAPSVPAG
jgi:protein-disulfide isomerase